MSVSARRPSSHESQQHRYRDTRRKLSGHLFDALTELEDVAVVGSDPLLAHFAQAAGVEPGSIACCQALVDDRPVTLVGVPSRLWYSRDVMARLQTVKASMASCGRSCFLLPQRALAELGRPDGKGSIADRARVIVELILHPERMGIEEACCSPESCDPVGCRAGQLLTGSDCTA